ncbi:transforming protein RhoA-like [Nasonia vitripennis]|uniref:Uncharacterized protein n=1 Tax=Nasonia vitripennis TaxID=7425 RepID=A0A7M7QI24_NASVI|nr:transforming protein RhoA-like [Nasonia vitripennis]
MSNSKRNSVIDSVPESTKLTKKLVVVGDGGCGKTCLLIVFTKYEFPTEYTPSFDNFQEYQMNLDGEKVELTLVDAIEAYDKLYPLYCRDADVVLLCFSICEPTSLSNVVNYWKPEVLDVHCPGVPILLVGNKQDLRHQPNDNFGRLTYANDVRVEPVAYEGGLDAARRIGALAYYECSARTGQGAKEVFEAAAKVAVHAKKGPESRKKKGCVLS